MNTFVFVYGTLKKGQINHDIMTAIGAEYISTEVIHGYALYDSCEYSFPLAVESDAHSDFIKGEVYKIDTSHMKTLDKFEGYDVNNEENSLFIRDICFVGSCVLGSRAWFYVFNKKIPSDSMKITDWF